MKQITIVTESDPGLLARVSEILAAREINIETLDAETVQDHGIVIEPGEDLRVFGSEQPVPPHLVRSADDLQW